MLPISTFFPLQSAYEQQSRASFRRRTQMSWASFDEFIIDSTNYVWVEAVEMEEEVEYRCPCPTGAKGKDCVHSLVVAMHHGDMDRPSEAEMLNVNKKRGLAKKQDYF